MARGKKMFKVLKSSDTEDVMEMFNEMLNSGHDNPKIFYPKYEDLHKQLSRWVKLLGMAYDKVVVVASPKSAEVICTYVDAKKQLLEVTHKFHKFHNLPEVCKLQLEEMPPDVREQIFGKYKALKDDPMVESIIIACNNLITYEAFIGKADALNDKFLMKTAGLIFAPIEDLQALNFKQLYINDKFDASDRKMILLILHKMLEISKHVHQVVTTPDIDLDKLSEVIMTSIADVKKHIPRCNDAFNKILEAVDLLKGNFGDYYNDYMSSNNPAIIMENFVVDVARKSDASPQITRQFRQIISYYKKLSSQHATNPKYKAIFKTINKNFDKIDRLGRAKTKEEAQKAMEEVDERPDEYYENMVDDFVEISTEDAEEVVVEESKE
jgi:hypothetical protein